MNGLPTINYVGGKFVPITNIVIYLGTVIIANGNYHAEISARITAIMKTSQRLSTFWTKTPLIKQCKLRVFDAAITIELLYGLESACLSNIDKTDLIPFRKKGLRKISGIRHAYFPRVATCSSTCISQPKG